MSSCPTQPAILRRIGLAFALAPVLLVSCLGGSAYAAITGLEQRIAVRQVQREIERRRARAEESAFRGLWWSFASTTA